jgi:hypothetical protein
MGFSHTHTKEVSWILEFVWCVHRKKKQIVKICENKMN